jgi:hypothetical protein
MMMRYTAWLLLMGAGIGLAGGCRSGSSKVATTTQPAGATAAQEGGSTRPGVAATTVSTRRESADPKATAKPASSWRGFMPSKNHDEDRAGWWTPDYRGMSD